MKILIADDHIILRTGLIQILADAFPQAEFGEAGTTQETIARLGEKPWDVLVLDIFMPGRSGLEVLAEVRQRHPRLPVLVLSSAPEEQLAVRALKAGAAGYLNKRAAAEALVEAIRKVAAGGIYTSAAMAERVIGELRRPPTGASLEKLSDREFEVFELLVAGKSIKEIAVEMALSAKTISTFHTRIWDKFGVHNDVELCRYAFERGLGPSASGSPPPSQA